MSVNPQQNNSLIELHIPDFELAKNFYGKLGFNVIWEREPEDKKGYLILKLEGNILCFYCGNEMVYQHSYFGRFSKDIKRGYGVEIVLLVNDVEKSFEEASKFAKVIQELKVKPWGLKDYRIEDPFGFYLRITELHDILDKNNAIP